MEEIEQMNGLFQQKQRELVVAVSRVEELSRQLDMLRGGKMDVPHEAGSSSSGELERLYKELQVAFFPLGLQLAMTQSCYSHVQWYLDTHT